MIRINRDKAMAAVIERLRTEREPRLAALDVEYMRALESGQGAADIMARKGALRDVTEKDFSALSIDQLATLTLDQALSI